MHIFTKNFIFIKKIFIFIDNINYIFTFIFLKYIDVFLLIHIHNIYTQYTHLLCKQTFILYRD